MNLIIKNEVLWDNLMKKVLLTRMTILQIICSTCSDTNTKPMSQTTSNIEISNDSATEAAAEVTEIKESTKDNSAWKEAYSAYINGMTYSSGKEKYDLIDFDNNGIPELIFESGIDSGGGSLSGFADGSINTVSISGSGNSFCNNYVCCLSGRQGMYTTKIVEVNNGWLKRVFEGKQSAQSWDFDMNDPYDFAYSYRLSNYQNVSYDDYSKTISGLYDSRNDNKINCQYDQSTIINAIINY